MCTFINDNGTCKMKDKRSASLLLSLWYSQNSVLFTGKACLFIAERTLCVSTSFNSSGGVIFNKTNLSFPSLSRLQHAQRRFIRPLPCTLERRMQQPAGNLRKLAHKQAERTALNPTKLTGKLKPVSSCCDKLTPVILAESRCSPFCSFRRTCGRVPLETTPFVVFVAPVDHLQP